MKACLRCKFSNEDDSSECSNCGSSLNPSRGENNFGNTYPLAQARNNGFAITSMVLGIVSIPMICCCYTGIIPGILAVIFGFLARNKLRTSFSVEKGEGMALAGIILGFITIGLVIILLAFSFSGVFSSNGFMQNFQKQFQDSLNNRPS
jgi:amino acid transporter